MTTVMTYAKMADEAYAATPTVSGWTTVMDHLEPSSGLRSVVFHRGGVFVVSFRGTDNLSDVVEDAQLTLGMNTAMYPVGEAIAAAAGQHGGVILTGHSLGGAVAQVVGNRAQLPFVTFNAPGVALIASRNIATANPVMAALRWTGSVSSALARPRQTARDMQAAFNVVHGKNYRLFNDVVSSSGVHYGDVITLPTPTTNPLDAHRITTVIAVLAIVAAGGLSFP